MIKIPEIDIFIAHADAVYKQIINTEKRKAVLIIARALLTEYGQGADANAVSILSSIEERISQLKDKQ